MLTTQYRMHREIAAFSSTMFYDSQLVTPQDNNKMDEGPPPPFGHLRWFDVAAGRSVREGTTQSNELEAAVVLDILKVVVQNQVRAFPVPLSPRPTKLTRASVRFWRGRGRGRARGYGKAAQVPGRLRRIGIISPYKGQTELLGRLVDSARFDATVSKSIEVHTVVRTASRGRGRGCGPGRGREGATARARG